MRVVGDDLIGVLGPGEWVGAVVRAVDADADGGLEVLDAVEQPTPDRLPGGDLEEDVDYRDYVHARGWIVDHA